jgi:hypothetical protein
MDDWMGERLPDVKTSALQRAERQPLIDRYSQPLFADQFQNINRRIDDQHDFADRCQ